MNLWLTEEQAREIAEYALREKPREACGLIGGVNGRAMRIIPVANVAANSVQQYYMDEAALTAAMFELERGGLSLIGIYHSHPEGEPISSPTDVRLAAYPGTAYLIVGLKHGQPEFAAWEIRGAEVNRVTLTVGGVPPESQPDKTLSPAAKMAIFTSAILAFILLIVLSLSLLPPAPPIPAH